MRLAGIAFLAVLLVGCGSQPAPPTATDPVASDEASLPEGEWQLTSGTVNGERISPVADEPITVTISGNRWSGWDGCNNYDLTVEATGASNVQAVQYDGEDRGCASPQLSEVSQRYTEALHHFDSYSLTDGELRLLGEDVELRFARV